MLKHGHSLPLALQSGISTGGAATTATTPALRSYPRSQPSQWQVAEPGTVAPQVPLLSGEQSWARRHYLLASRHHWSPADISLEADIAAWQASEGLREEERTVLLHGLSWLIALDAATSPHPPALSTWRLLDSVDCRQFLARQLFDESQRPTTARAITDALGIDTRMLAASPEAASSAQRMGDWLAARHKVLAELVRSGAADPQGLCDDLATCHVATKAVFVQLVAIQLLAIARRGHLPGIARLFRHMLRDEIAHLQFGLALMGRVGEGYQDMRLDGLRNALTQAVELATTQAYASLPRGLPGLNAPMLEEYLAYAANRCCRSLSLPELQPGAGNPFSWMTELRPVRGTAVRLADRD